MTLSRDFPLSPKWGIQLFATETSGWLPQDQAVNLQARAASTQQRWQAPADTERGAAGTGTAHSPCGHAARAAWLPRRCWRRATREDSRTDPAFGNPTLQPDQFSSIVDYIKNKCKVGFWKSHPKRQKTHRTTPHVEDVRTQRVPGSSRPLGLATALSQWMLHRLPTEEGHGDLGRLDSRRRHRGRLANAAADDGCPLCSTVPLLPLPRSPISSRHALTAPCPPPRRSRLSRPLPRVLAAAVLPITGEVFFLLPALVPEVSGSRRSNCVHGLRSDK